MSGIGRTMKEKHCHVHQFLKNRIKEKGTLRPIYTHVKFPLDHYHGKAKLFHIQPILRSLISLGGNWQSYQIKTTKRGFKS